VNIVTNKEQYIHYHKVRKTWHVRITRERVVHHIGTFKTLVEAVAARDAAIPFYPKMKPGPRLPVYKNTTPLCGVACAGQVLSIPASNLL
jgi:hypothetical protein